MFRIFCNELWVVGPEKVSIFALHQENHAVYVDKRIYDIDNLRFIKGFMETLETILDLLCTLGYCNKLVVLETLFVSSGGWIWDYELSKETLIIFKDYKDTFIFLKGIL